MPRFRHYNYDQDSTVVINYQDQLQPGTFEHTVHHLFAHSKGIPSSRDMQWCCETPIPFKALSCDTVYYFSALAKRLNRFSLRDKTKAQGQRPLYCLARNIEKLKNYGQLAA